MMIKTTKLLTDDADTYCARANRVRRNLAQKLDWCSWDTLAHRRYFSFAGHLARIEAYDPGRPSVRVLKFKNYQFLERLMDRNQGRQIHCRRLRIWRWERPLWLRHGADWSSVALNAEWWKNNLDAMAAWRTHEAHA